MFRNTYTIKINTQKSKKLTNKDIGHAITAKKLSTH